MLITKRDLLVGSLAAAATLAFVRHHEQPEDLPPAHHNPHAPPARPSPQIPPDMGAADKTVKHKFIETAQYHPLVKVLRRSVCLTETYLSQGSAILLDRMGTLALTAHQVHSTVMKVRFLPHPDNALHYCDTRAVLIAQDKKTDTSYWRLVDPSVINAYGLQPIQWGHIGNGEHHFGETVLSMGFPGYGHGELDAAPHKIEEYASSIMIQDERMLQNGQVQKYTYPINCKIEETETVGAGNSGGGIFDDSKGGFLGTVTSSSSGIP